MVRFFAAPAQIDRMNSKICLEGPDVRHMKNVLRLSPGEELWISDGDKTEYHCIIKAYEENDRADLQILYAQQPDYELPCAITLYQGLPKADKMEWIIQKAVELGAEAVVPVRTRRSILKLDEARGSKKLARWQQISLSASEQSRRLHVPQIGPVMDFTQALQEARTFTHILIPYELKEGMESLREFLSELHPGDSLAIFIGPEGGFEENEIRQAIEAGALPVSLGKRILRTETAGMTLLAAVMLMLEMNKQTGTIE